MLPAAPAPGYRPVRRVAQILEAALAVMGVVLVVATIAVVRRWLAVRSLDPEASVDHVAALDHPTNLLRDVNVVYAVLLMALGILIAVWCHRVHHNLHGPLRAHDLRFRPGWAAGWWFVPVANLWMPRLVVVEAWRASDPDGPTYGDGWRSRPVPGLIDAWWGFFVAFAVLPRLAVYTFHGDDRTTAGALTARCLVVGAGSAAGVVAAVLAVVVVRRTTQRHLARAANAGIHDR